MNVTPERWIPWAKYAIAATVGVGLLWRAVRFSGSFPVWGDEAMLLLNILDRDFTGLTQPLSYAQVAPPFFLWLEKIAILLFGPSEQSVHLFPFLAGLLGIFVFWRTCRASFKPRVAGLSLSILAVSYYPVRHCVEVKPYVFDLLFAIMYSWLTLGQLREPSTWRWLAGLAVLAPIAVFSSYPSVFVGGAVCLLLLPSMRYASWRQRGIFVLFILTLCGAFLINLKMLESATNDTDEARLSSEFLLEYWKGAFPPDSPLEWPLWLLRVFTGNTLAYPIGSKNGGSTLTFLLVMLGSVALWRRTILQDSTGTMVRNGRTLLSLCWLPFAFNLIAAMLHKYPFGESARITLYLAPFICILMAHGIDELLSLNRLIQVRHRCEIGIYALLLLCGIICIARDLRCPYKTIYDMDVRQLVRDLHLQSGNDQVWLCHENVKELPTVFLWYIRTQIVKVRSLSTSEQIPSTVETCWLVRFGVVEPTLAELVRPGWRVQATNVREIRPENSKNQTTYFRWVHLVRD